MLAISAVLGVLVLVPVIRPISESLLARPVGTRLLSLARFAAATAPTHAADWDSWARQLPVMLPEVRAAILPMEPGTPEFVAACRQLGLDPSRAAQAFAEGELLTRIGLSRGQSLPGTPRAAIWEAMAVVQDLAGRRGLLVLVERPEARAPTASSWGLATLFGLLVLFIALLGGFLAGYFLLVRPVAAAATIARRSVRSDHPAHPADLAVIRASLDAAVRTERELATTVERQGIRIRQIQSDLKGAQAGLIRAEKLASVGQLAAGIAHEIGNPIGVILGMSEILKDGEDAEQTRAFAAQIHAATLRVHGTLKDLLAFARPVREEGALADVAVVVDQTLKLLQPHRSFGQVRVATRIDASPLTAEIRPSQLQQVLVNLLLNAADATKGKGNLEVSARRADRFVEIRVTDDGPGIAAEEQERIFDPFYSTKPPGEGTGLGLSICAQLVEVYGGEITVESTPGKGATFLLRLWSAGPEAFDPPAG